MCVGSPCSFYMIVVNARLAATLRPFINMILWKGVIVVSFEGWGVNNTTVIPILP
jgi:hypothetical protein